jgi:hypothetical protein
MSTFSTSNLLAIFEDEQPRSYLPTGRSLERLLNAPEEDYDNWTSEDFEKCRLGLLDDLGSHGADIFHAESHRRSVEREYAEDLVAGKVPPAPPWLEVLQNWSEMTGQEFEQWGFVVFRTCAYGNEARWGEMRRRWDQIIDEEIGERSLAAPGAREARQKLQFQWVEDPKLEGAEPATLAK